MPWDKKNLAENFVDRKSGIHESNRAVGLTEKAVFYPWKVDKEAMCMLVVISLLALAAAYGVLYLTAYVPVSLNGSIRSYYICDFYLTVK